MLNLEFLGYYDILRLDNYIYILRLETLRKLILPIFLISNYCIFKIIFYFKILKKGDAFFLIRKVNLFFPTLLSKKKKN